MNFTPILAEDISPVVLVVFLAPLFLGLLALRFIDVSRRTRRASPAGLIISLVAVFGGGVILFFLLTVRGGAPSSFIEIAAVPVVLGLCGLYLQWRKSREAPQTDMQDVPPSSPPAKRKFSVPTMVVAWLFFLILLLNFCMRYLHGSLAGEEWILVSLLILFLVWIPVQIIRHLRKQK